MDSLSRYQLFAEVRAPFGLSLCWLNPLLHPGKAGVENSPHLFTVPITNTEWEESPAPAFPSNLTSGVVQGMEAGRKDGENENCSLQPGSSSMRGAPQPAPLRGYWVLRQQTQLGTPVSRQEVTLHGNAITQKIKVSF